jgi:hypothetical protein
LQGKDNDKKESILTKFTSIIWKFLIITIIEMYYFIITPTLCYQRNYPQKLEKMSSFLLLYRIFKLVSYNFFYRIIILDFYFYHNLYYYKPIYISRGY